MNIVSLCELAGVGASDEAARAKAIIDELFMTLVLDAERTVRRRLAERLAEVTWAPKALIHVLALDDIEIARPVIARSPLLEDDDLVRLLLETTLEHQIEVARRPEIGPKVCDTILDMGDPAVLVTLAANLTARLPEGGMARMVDGARTMPALRAPLVRHPALTAALGTALYAWVGDVLQGALVDRFHLDPEALGLAMGEAVREAKTAPFGRPIQIERSEDHEAMEQRLVEKLDAAGQLKPGYLMRALREHKLSLFEAGLARLSGLPLEDLQAAVTCDRPDVLAMACVAAHIDRSVFRTILARVRELNGGKPGGDPEADTRASALFHELTPKDAVIAFSRMVQVVAAA
ncbi:MAG TPA: DUF2336 domain-containing protein [Caulobacteraceae bacterium]